MKSSFFLLCFWLVSQDNIAESNNKGKEQAFEQYCGDYYNETSGIRVIKVPNYSDVDIYCDQDTDGGRWNVFQRRLDGSEDFNRGWSDYRNGFGDPDKEFWLGLEALHQMTNYGRKYELRFDLQTNKESMYYAVYDNFSIGSESEGYAIHFTGYSGNAPDSFTYHKDMKFSTKDRDEDRTRLNCAAKYNGGWWYDYCMQTNLNGLYNTTKYAKDIYWKNITGYNESLKKTEIKFRVKI